MRSFSHSDFSTRVRGFASPTKTAGFTLVELLISVAIIGVISSIVLVKYSSFDSTVILKGYAYEIALGLRETQIKAVSVVRNNDGFDYPYGMTFSVGASTNDPVPDSKKYMAFVFGSASVYPHYDHAEATPVADVLQTFDIPRSMFVSEICVTAGASERCSSDGSNPVTRLDISFRRPEYKALFFATRDSGDLSTTISSAKIKVSSTNDFGGNVFVVKIGMFGDITVCKEGATNCS